MHSLTENIEHTIALAKSAQKTDRKDMEFIDIALEDVSSDIVVQAEQLEGMSHGLINQAKQLNITLKNSPYA